MKTKVVRVIQEVEITIDETKFDENFLKEFESYMFRADLNDHIDHLAILAARGIINDYEEFIEGYGDPIDMGIKVKVLNSYCD